MSSEVNALDNSLIRYPDNIYTAPEVCGVTNILLSLKPVSFRCRYVTNSCYNLRTLVVIKTEITLITLRINLFIL